jgi:co-chaperonin GroES (HSP10)
MLKPLGNRLIVKPDEIVTKTDSGIIIEYGSNEKLEKGARITGTVVAVGDLCWFDYPGWPNNPWVEVGDKVFWAKYAGKVIVDPYTGEDFIALNDEDVIVSAHE